jgi:hypothetical protein
MLHLDIANAGGTKHHAATYNIREHSAAETAHRQRPGDSIAEVDKVRFYGGGHTRTAKNRIADQELLSDFDALKLTVKNT